MSNSAPTTNLPLYRPIVKPEPSVSMSSNAGLWYDKFCDRWNPGWRSGLGDGGKTEWVKAFSGQYLGDDTLLDEMADRRIALLKASNGQALTFKTQGPMVSGLGRTHPVENGFAWHHILGVPYLPGSSVKGAVRSFALTWLGIEDRIVSRIFGPSSKGGGLNVGSVIFLDAIPTMSVRLKAEVMTPHYGPYYAGANPEPPGDWHNPIPIPFLAVDSGQEFLFGVLPRTGVDEEDCTLASRWLSQSLRIMGAGAKTSSGYGRFSGVRNRNKGQRWLKRQSREQENDDAFLRDSPKIVLGRWQEIKDPEIKKQAALEIRRRYMKMGSWDSPFGALKQAKKVYKEYLDSLEKFSEG
jgi:CRISPR-associated protein Cmr6